MSHNTIITDLALAKRHELSRQKKTALQRFELPEDTYMSLASGDLNSALKLTRALQEQLFTDPDVVAVMHEIVKLEAKMDSLEYSEWMQGKAERDKADGHLISQIVTERIMKELMGSGS